MGRKKFPLWVQSLCSTFYVLRQSFVDDAFDKTGKGLEKKMRFNL